MRNINTTIEVTDNVTLEKTATKESIAYYTVNIKSKYIDVRVEFLAEDGSVIKFEDFYFSGDKYRESPSENELWNLVDRERG